MQDEGLGIGDSVQFMGSDFSVEVAFADPEQPCSGGAPSVADAQGIGYLLALRLAQRRDLSRGRRLMARERGQMRRLDLGDVAHDHGRFNHVQQLADVARP